MYQPFTNRRQLKPNSVPTKFSFSEPPSTQRRNKSSVSQKLKDVQKEISTEIHEETNKGTTSRTYSKCFVTDEHEETNQGCTSGTYSECFVNDENEEINQSNTYANVHDHIEIEKDDTFPTKKTVLETMPKPFLVENKNCRVIIDCTEFPIQKPSCPLQQQMTFSYYKNCNTLKGMIGIMPSGAICFVSHLHCGSISDKELFLRSKLMDHLEPNDVVMADKGFLIEAELAKVGCKLKCPLFFKKQNPISCFGNC
ncbi:uncharacterized protein TNCT_613383 [Trichonephila clavata]|uniref:DDE Tnp4 domain-containing protein n=2 Tax=Trichonephila clavata TaxID=2740835 RepID=A0A8X6FX54_TRICU|nr:uncharacterized protein TNCT_613382 [Trichonephila clavata]GFQ91465.1 uncharacterized protein TNCT_613383 [Trichonephila clavata]